VVAAKGGVFAQNGIVPYAKGGIVDKPTYFPFSRGIGLMGEAGPEAIVPLKRGKDGKLGIAGGGGSTVVNVSVDAKGTKVEGDTPTASQLGKLIGVAVKAELIKEQRPGGLLSN
jgi:lambda family phage tail tape measure protein